LATLPVCDESLVNDAVFQSGFGGRDNGVHAFDRYTQLKTLWMDIADRQLESGIA
jgi:acyl-CoA reductase-like NAD-dependent aldehyde dehydrogenase